MSDKISISCGWSQWNCVSEYCWLWMAIVYFSDYGHILTISTLTSQQVPDFQQGLKLAAFDSKSCGQVFLLRRTPKTRSARWVLCRKGKGGFGEIRLSALGSLAAADGVIPPQPSTSSARGRDVLQDAKAAHGFVFQDGKVMTAYVGGIKRNFECF